jgi:hypothetical protein
LVDIPVAKRVCENCAPSPAVSGNSCARAECHERRGDRFFRVGLALSARPAIRTSDLLRSGRFEPKQMVCAQVFMRRGAR